MEDTMLLNTEELLAMAHGDADPDRLAVLLDRLEDCPDSKAALEVLVSLKANREEALETLRLAAENDPTVPVPYPERYPVPMPRGWALQGLRLAGTIALVAMFLLWLLSKAIEAPPPPLP